MQTNLRFFKDTHGHIVIWQQPNLPLLGWLVCKILATLSNESEIKSGFMNISSAFLFTWAFLEITQGVNYFRRLLGLIVMIILVIGFFQ